MHNTIQWLPWGREAFEKAKTEQKPVFLHIGFPSCHWCHVMERESFHDPEVADYLNQNYICVNVDREERPDVDAVYMAACQSMTGQGGWPLTALLSPSQEPFYVATYMSKADFLALLRETIDLWQTERGKLATISGGLKQAVKAIFDHGTPSAPPERRIMRNAVRAYGAIYDSEWGGTGITPKFPMPHTLQFLLRLSHLEKDHNALAMAEHTLQRMCEGSLFDHVGGGFMRYATDRRWVKPHYEKMLSDNAMLIDAYLEAWQITGRNLYRSVAERTIHYVMDEMTSMKGGFYASQDADSEGQEGAYYHLTRRELISLLGKSDGEAYASYYGLTDQGTAPHRLNHEGGIETQRMASLSQRIKIYRAKRMPLKRDDKIVTSWNGMMIVALANAYTVLGNKVYLAIAKKAALWTANHMQQLENTLFAHWRDDIAQGEGLLNDYAQTALAALTLYRATLEDHWLSWAVNLARTMLSHFEDREKGGFFLTPHGGEPLIARPKETYDGAEPSGNALALQVLTTLSALNVGEGWEEAARRQAAFLSGVAADAPTQHMAGLTGVLPLVYPISLLEAHATASENEKLLENLRGRYMPLLFLKATQPGAGGNNWRLCQGTSCLTPFQVMEQAVAALGKGVQ